MDATVFSVTRWVIAHRSKTLYWSNQYGWVDRCAATEYDADERYGFPHLPAGGAWRTA